MNGPDGYAIDVKAKAAMITDQTRDSFVLICAKHELIGIHHGDSIQPCSTLSVDN
jgi:hypothetical protein